MQISGKSIMSTAVRSGLRFTKKKKKEEVTLKRIREKKVV